MSPAFDERTRQVIIETAKEIGIDVHPKGETLHIWLEMKLLSKLLHL